MLTCRYPDREDIQKLPCVFRPWKPKDSAEVFENVRVRVFDPDKYFRQRPATSGIECAFLALLLGSNAFIFKKKSLVCFLHNYTSACRAGGRVPLPSGNKIMAKMVRLACALNRDLLLKF